MIPEGGTVGPEWIADYLPGLEDGEGAVVRDHPGYAHVRRLAAVPWVAVGGPETRAAKRTLIEGEGNRDRKWQRPKFDGVVDFTMEGSEERGVVVGDPGRPELAMISLWELLSGMRIGDLVDFVPRLGMPALRVRLLAYTAPLEAWNLPSAAEREAFAERLRAEGTTGVSLDRLDFAAKKYERALPFAEGVPRLQAALHLNLAAVALRSRRWGEAVRQCDAVLAGPDKRSARAWLRRGRAYTELGKLDLAKEDLKRVPDGAPEHAEARQALRRVAAIEAREDRSVRGVYQAMFGKDQE